MAASIFSWLCIFQLQRRTFSTFLIIYLILKVAVNKDFACIFQFCICVDSLVIILHVAKFSLFFSQLTD